MTRNLLNTMMVETYKS